MPIGAPVGQRQPVDLVHGEGVIPVPVGENRQVRRRQPLRLQRPIEFVDVGVGVSRVHRQAEAIAPDIAQIRAIPLRLEGIDPYAVRKLLQ